jgi:hypothetical protein
MVLVCDAPRAAPGLPIWHVSKGEEALISRGEQPMIQWNDETWDLINEAVRQLEAAWKVAQSSQAGTAVAATASALRIAAPANVHAGIERLHQIAGLGARGQHDEVGPIVPPRLQLLADRHAGHTGHHPIQEYEHWVILRFQNSQSFCPITRCHYIVTPIGEMFLQNHPYSHLIVDNQNLRH